MEKGFHQTLLPFSEKRNVVFYNAQGKRLDDESIPVIDRIFAFDEGFDEIERRIEIKTFLVEAVWREKMDKIKEKADRLGRKTRK